MIADPVVAAFVAYRASGGDMGATEWHIKGNVPQHPVCNLCSRICGDCGRDHTQ